MEKRVLITGGTKGIGRAVAECLAKAGYSLILTYASDKEEALRVADGLLQQYKVEGQKLLLKTHHIISVHSLNQVRK